MKDSNRALLLVLKGAISELPQADQDKVKVIADELRQRYKADVDGHFVMAFSLVGAEMAADE